MSKFQGTIVVKLADQQMPDDFIEKMLAKDRDIRYQDPQELMGDIEAQISGKKTLEVEEDAGGPDEDVAARRRRRIERLRRRRLRG